MKKIILIASISLFSFIFSSCSDSNSKGEFKSETTGIQIGTDGKSKKVELIPSVMFNPEAYIWQENSDGKLEPYSKFYAGQVFYAYPSMEGSESDEVEAYKFATKSAKEDAEKYTYAKILYNGNDYWVDIDFLEPNSTPKVVINDGYNYKSDHMTDNSKNKIEKGTIVAVRNDYVKSEDSDINCVNASWRKTSKSNYKDIYLKSEILSDKDDDVIAQRYLNRLENIKNETVISEIYENCKQLDLSDDYRSKINEQINKQLSK